ncbi:NADH-quinone oxidoreductase subunit J [Acidithiobacillus sp.]|uniref:NADH-quinone oxidoreductase subunit J family protein n=1 Tax=Acidithiobacillus sp. TaxID=1872118 RepID=UPI0025BC3002|nr:NADH-quinone oxidoreductase subunit J [Acidithiobacillus sp.]
MMPLALILVLLVIAVLAALAYEATPMRGAVLFGILLLLLALLFLLLEAPFVAALEVILYLGAILVLFLFAIMLLGPEREANTSGQRFRRGAGPALGLLCALALVLGLLLLPQPAPRFVPHPLSIAQIGAALFGPWLWLMEALAVLLFAVIGAVLAIHHGEDDRESR